MRTSRPVRSLKYAVYGPLFLVHCLLVLGCNDDDGVDAAIDADATADADVTTDADERIELDADTDDAARDDLDGDRTEADADHSDPDALDADDADEVDADEVDADEVDADEVDADEPDEERPPCLRLTLDDGREISGEHLATYDHRLWWDASDQLTYALFDASRLAEYPDDGSLSFTSSLVVVSLVEETLPIDVTPYDELLRDHGVVIEGVPLDGVSYVITGNEGYHLEENGYGDFAFDFVRTDAAGHRFTGDGLDNEDFLVWDDEVTLPTDGYVVEVVRDAPDNVPGSYPDGAVNNMVGVHLFGSFYLYLLHFMQDSIPEDVEVGASLARGHVLGRVGNAGVSLEPHLHVALLWYDESAPEPRSWSVPVEFQGVHTAPTATGPSVYEAYAVPLGGTWIAEDAF